MLDYKMDQRWTVQRQSIDKTKEFFKNNKKFVLIQGPTGFGKSIMALVLAKEVGSTYITSPRVTLVDQYQRMLNTDFVGLGRPIKGLVNYSCVYSGNKETAAKGLCHLPGYKFKETGKTGCPVQKDCKYYTARNEAINANTAVMTFQYFMYPVRSAILKREDMEFNKKLKSIQEGTSGTPHSYTWQRRKMLIIDEAHNLPEELVGFFTLVVHEHTFGSGVFDVLKRHQIDRKTDLLMVLKEELTRIKPIVESLLEEIVKSASRTTDTETILFRNAKYTSKEFITLAHQQMALARKISGYLEAISKNTDWVYSRDGDAFVWKPFEATTYVKQIFDAFDYVILMSASFMDHAFYAKRLGIADYGFINIPSRFDASKGKIYLYYDNWLRRDSSDAVKGRVVARIEEISKKYSKYKGIIHCHSYPLQQYIFAFASPELRHRFILHDSSTRSKALDEFLESKTPKILLSVNMEQGLDLKDDAARWQIIVKSPYPYVGDEWVKAHRERMPEWATNITLITLIQACGRIVRTETDWGHTYVLDGNASSLFDKNKDKLPLGFKARLQHLR